MYRYKGSTTTHTQITVPLDRQGTHYQSQGQDKQIQDDVTPLSYICVKHCGNTYLIFPTVFHPCYNNTVSHTYTLQMHQSSTSSSLSSMIGNKRL